MNNSRKGINYLLDASGVVLIAVSIYCFWNAYRIRQQLLERAGNDPFAVVFIDKIEPRTTGGIQSEVITLNYQRLRNENAGWILIIAGIILILSALALRRKRDFQTLGISESK